MVGLVGLEPMTSTMSTWRSNQLSYNPLRIVLYTILGKMQDFFSIFGKLTIHFGSPCVFSLQSVGLSTIIIP